MRARVGVALVAMAMLALASAGAARAAITVANTNDSGPGSLRQAVAEAPPGETINLPAGTYTLSSGELVIVRGLKIEGHGAGDTTIRSGGPFRVIEIVGNFDFTISGVTIRDGKASPPSAQGAGILSVEAGLTLRSVGVTNNAADGDGAPGVAGSSAEGGGVLSTGPLTLIDSTVTHNAATSVGGSGKNGGVAQGGGVLSTNTLTASNTTIADNRADARGGQGPSSAEQDGGVTEGAGLLAVTGESSAASTLSGLTINGNTSDSSAGPGGSGGIVEGGGVVLAANSGSLTVANTTITGNVGRSGPGGGAAIGGGLLAVGEEPNAVTIESSTLAGNRLEAPEAGPGSGGGNLATVHVRIGNTIVALGTGPAGAENCGGLPPTSLGFNLDSLDQCGFHAAGDQVGKDPRLGPLQDNGGPTATMLPAADSPAVDQGSAFALAGDQRGVARPIDFPTIPNSTAPGADGADIGAVELQPSNAFSLGKLRKNRKKGTATLSVRLPEPSAGALVLKGKGLKTKQAAITGQSLVRLKVVAKGGALKALRKKGKRKVKIKVTYAPTGNAAATLSRTAKLIRGHKKRHGHQQKHHPHGSKR